jgi:hypothetical protein
VREAANAEQRHQVPKFRDRITVNELGIKVDSSHYQQYLDHAALDKAA